MKLLIIETAGNLWGSERALLDFIDAGHGITIGVCCPPGSQIIAELERRGIRTFPYFLSDLHLKSRWRRLQAAIGVLWATLLFRPSAIHLNQSGGFRVVQVAARLLRKPIVCHVRIFEDAAYLAQLAPDRRVLRAMVAISKAVEAELRSYAALDAIPVFRIYDAYAPNGASQLRGRRAPRIACVGRVTPIKGQEVLVDALTSTSGFPAEAECWFAGDGETAYISKLMTQSEMASITVRWLGFLQEVAPILNTSSVLACPSHREPLGRVIFEAWDAGLVPVVFSGAGGAAEIVDAADGGILYGEQTASALGDALQTALTLPEGEADRLVANGRKWMHDNCNLNSYGEAISHLFAAALKKPVPSGRRLAPPMLPRA